MNIYQKQISRYIRVCLYMYLHCLPIYIYMYTHLITAACRGSRLLSCPDVPERPGACWAQPAEASSQVPSAESLAPEESAARQSEPQDWRYHRAQHWSQWYTPNKAQIRHAIGISVDVDMDIDMFHRGRVVEDSWATWTNPNPLCYRAPAIST